MSLTQIDAIEPKVINPEDNRIAVILQNPKLSGLKANNRMVAASQMKIIAMVFSILFINSMCVFTSVFFSFLIIRPYGLINKLNGIKTMWS